MLAKPDTIIRTICLALALANQILLALGKSPIPVSDETVQTLITVGFTTVTAVWAWWKNNSFTPWAIAGDAEMDRVKKEIN